MNEEDQFDLTSIDADGREEAKMAIIEVPQEEGEGEAQTENR